jgi:hypothetical protein
MLAFFWNRALFSIEINTDAILVKCNVGLLIQAFVKKLWRLVEQFR